ncbi:MAG TPA: ferritin-like domain-containing protein [Blastocatellia bacterium]|nr:ferritin-like domain-containing protein [Blastocatellia bacterium]
MDKSSDHKQLVHILQAAYSGELAAAYAYRGHWKSLGNPAEREKIRQIENEEWIHREKVGLMLASLGASPVKTREAKMWLIGRAIGIACHFTGWFLPMYFAGRLESGNVEEYNCAAFHARESRLLNFESDLRVMAGVEKEHEIFFMKMVAGHRLLPLMRAAFKWGREGRDGIKESKPAPSSMPGD